MNDLFRGLVSARWRDIRHGAIKVAGQHISRLDWETSCAFPARRC
jgi:hypothetical protein